MDLLDASTENLLTQYRLSLEAANRSPKTVSGYLPILRCFFSFLKENGYSIDVNEVGREEVRAYIRHLQEKERWDNKSGNGKGRGKMSPFSVQGHVRVIKALFSWLASDGIIARHPLAKFSLPRVPKKRIKTVEALQFKTLLLNINKSTPIGAKYYCIITMLLDTGIRISELVKIKMIDLDMAHRLLKIIGKGQKERVVPFSLSTRRELSHYINNFRPRLCPEDTPYLFPSVNEWHITVNSVQQYIRRLAKKSGLDGTKISPHIFRHTFATLTIASGANLFAVKDMMGHESLATTMKYTHLTDRDLREQHDRFSPLNDFLKTDR